MLIKKINRPLSNLEHMCTLCSRDVSLSDDYIATYNRKQYKMCHKKCYDNYLKFIKESRIKYE